jgi:hypothetical protein
MCHNDHLKVSIMYSSPTNTDLKFPAYIIRSRRPQSKRCQFIRIYVLYINVIMSFQTQNPMVVHVYHPYRQPDGVNHCAAVNGHCSHLCLPAPQINSKSPKISCSCPNGLMLMSDGLMCAEEGKRRNCYYIILFDIHNRYYNLYYYRDT